MQITSKIPELTERSALTIGNFDGLHVGHTGLVNQLVSYARNNNLISVMVTFNPHPIELLKPGMQIPRITGLTEMKSLLEPLGLDYLVQLPFTHDTAGLSPGHFFKKIVVGGFNPKMVIVGQDHHFGKNREGTPEKLRQLGQDHNLEIIVFPQVIEGGEPVSSTRIRKHILQGEIQRAKQLLGHPLMYSGTVVRGAGRGSQLGYPTANLELPGRCLPGPGVYASHTYSRNKWWKSMSYLGKSPTFNGDVTRLETHLFADPGPMYDEVIVVDIVEKTRDEIRFTCQKDLIKQMHSDGIQVKKILTLCQG